MWLGKTVRTLLCNGLDFLRKVVGANCGMRYACPETNIPRAFINIYISSLRAVSHGMFLNVSSAQQGTCYMLDA